MEHADREIPAPQQVTADGVRYAEAANARMRGFAQSGGVIIATDIETGKELWVLQVYTAKFDAAEERDMQETFITALEVSTDGRHLQVTNEDGARFSVDLQTRAVTPVSAR